MLEAIRVHGRFQPVIFARVTGLFLLLTAPIAFSTEVTPSGGYRWAVPVRLALASCSSFSWSSDLPLASETVHLLRQQTMEFGLEETRIDRWNDGTAKEFLEWFNGVSRKGDGRSTLILYFSTHQWSNGRTKFAHGKDLEPEELVGSVNDAARQYRRVLFINDSCHAAGLERFPFSENVIRIYSAQENQDARDLFFDKGPYGLQDFVRTDRKFLEDRLHWKPKGMSFLGVIGLRAARQLGDRSPPVVDLRMLVKEMQHWRNRYDETVRQSKVQQFVVVPPDANFELLEKIAVKP